MSRWLLVPALALVATTAVADAPMTKEQYAKKHYLVDGDTSQRDAINRCLHAWGEHPFGDGSGHKLRVIETSVRVMGFGGSETVDSDVTSYPQLILIRPSVNAMTKTTYQFLNPKGWYCFDTSVTALGASIVKIHCDAHLADVKSGTNVLGEDQRDGGVVVLGKSEVQRLCE